MKVHFESISESAADVLMVVDGFSGVLLFHCSEKPKARNGTPSRHVDARYQLLSMPRVLAHRKHAQSHTSTSDFGNQALVSSEGSSL